MNPAGDTQHGRRLTRRRFLGAAAGVAVGAAGLGAYERGTHRTEPASRPKSHYRAIVIGSGYGVG